MSKTYTAVTRNQNSWTQDKDGANVVYDATWDCGHKHRSLLATCRCLRSMGAAACSYRARIECTDGNIYNVDGYCLND